MQLFFILEYLLDEKLQLLRAHRNLLAHVSDVLDTSRIPPTPAQTVQQVLLLHGPAHLSATPIL